jgi:hypothetical protein
MISKLIATICALCLTVSPASASYASFSFGHGMIPTLHTATCVSDTANATTYNPAGFQAIAVPGVISGERVVVAVGVLGEDSAATFGANSMTINGVAATEIVDEDGTGFVDASFWRSNGFIVLTAATINVSVTFSEAITSAVVCVWVMKNLNSATPTSFVQDDDTNSAALVLTTSTTALGGFVLGICGGTAVADTVAWAVITELEDTQHAEADYSTAQGPATGASMSNTCDFTNSNDNSGAAVAFR